MALPGWHIWKLILPTTPILCDLSTCWICYCWTWGQGRKCLHPLFCLASFGAPLPSFCGEWASTATWHGEVGWSGVQTPLPDMRFDIFIDPHVFEALSIFKNHVHSVVQMGHFYSSVLCSLALSSVVSMLLSCPFNMSVLLHFLFPSLFSIIIPVSSQFFIWFIVLFSISLSQLFFFILFFFKTLQLLVWAFL